MARSRGVRRITWCRGGPAALPRCRISPFCVTTITGWSSLHGSRFGISGRSGSPGTVCPSFTPPARQDPQAQAHPAPKAHPGTRSCRPDGQAHPNRAGSGGRAGGWAWSGWSARDAPTFRGELRRNCCAAEMIPVVPDAGVAALWGWVARLITPALPEAPILRHGKGAGAMRLSPGCPERRGAMAVRLLMSRAPLGLR